MKRQAKPGRAPRVHDITVRLKRRDGKPFTEREARAALWKAHKLASRGEDADSLTDWTLEAINWRNTNARTNVEKTYQYGGDDAWAVLANMAGILNTVGKDGIRVGNPED